MKSGSASLDIDWPRVHIRLAAAIANTREIFNPSAERAERLLEERARRLACPLASNHEVGAWQDLLAFQLSGERYGIETRHVREIIGLSGLTVVPGAPEVVAGVANLRGQVLVVFDIRPLLGLAPQGGRETSPVLVCGATNADLGLLVDAANDVVRILVNEIFAEAIVADAASISVIRGLTPDALIVLDGAALLSDQRLFVGDARRRQLDSTENHE
jgi:purine-binding chemotaxis protein CheW